jgi:DNA invertase Pin-like site-specific DNA recombinase
MRTVGLRLADTGAQTANRDFRRRGYSGGSTDRPDLQRLLDDIRSRKIDVIVVYKVDRLTRSLADFAKLVELFDAHGVSFVSVTQQFNTTTSMGRLTLNVLLSFAQFEREVTSERIRDKIAASKRKGLWVGGNLPCGYEMKDDEIAIVEEEAELVRSIFHRYLELGSVNALVRDLRERNIRTRVKLLATGATRGGIPFGRGTLYYLLSNHFYIGEVKYKNEILPGEQPAIMDRALFDAVRQKSLAQWSHRTIVRNNSDHLLTGLLCSIDHYQITVKLEPAWSRALEFAAFTKATPEQLPKLFKNHSGIAGCARWAAKQKPKKETYRDDWALDPFPGHIVVQRKPKVSACRKL